MAELTISGVYNGRNLYVQNPFTLNPTKYCVQEVWVNGNVTWDNTQASAFEINLRKHNLKPHEPVTVTIIHKDGCTPRVLNPEVLKPGSR